ncbi:protein of unknown function [Pelagirhabdus alkalitolerans]|uniref:DUF4397 domain-containing protein n=1 Tax=Pelagirhabdus alkalitolerans TaxID=1612202 RepID=A0A1G6HCJ8_9BACI|nr:DUF4397 domain-containing protein [Pelagirhabdus alkalitolerans]SDB91873.1 protein of unknown function [Pelagirhabdus alkalitolerans]
MKKVKVLATLIVSVLVMSLVGSPVFAHEHEEARVRVLHASPDAPSVDVYVNGELTVEDIAFQDITDYLELEAGSYDIAIHAAGDDEAVYEQSLDVEAGTYYTVAAVDLLEGGDFRLEALVDDTTVEEGQLKLRVGHLSPGAPAVDVGLIDGDSLVEGAEFFAVTDYLELDPATYDLEIRAAGTTDQVLDLSDTTLEENMIYSVYAVGADADELDIVLVADEAYEMPEELPETGAGSAAESNTLPLMIGSASLAGLVLFVKTRKHATER